MLISIDWISEFVDIPQMTPKDLGVKFTLATAEVEKVITEGDFLKKIKVAEILQIERHPDADKLNLVTFNFGSSENFQVVCGAPGLAVGMKVPYAPLGTELPGGFVLTPKKIRGVLSEGMLCSAEELGLVSDTDGLLELDSDLELGTNMLNVLGKKQDTLLDVDNKSLTHRPDLWGHYGMAREFAAIFNNELKNPFNKDWAKKLESNFTSDKSPVTPKVIGQSSCKSYWGLNVENITVTESPQWMQSRLISAGLRPINNMVDISNYVMLELGIPNHIFDRDMIKGNSLNIQKLDQDIDFVTLDEENRKLISGDTVISDSESPLVIAGIMGGLSSGVTSGTKTIFIEVANWKASEVRTTSTRLGLRTDSSQRYEKSLDSQLCKRTALRILDLVLELCPNSKVVGKLEYDGDSLDNFQPIEIVSSVDKISKVLGTKLDELRITSILESLSFGVKTKGNNLEITVPSFRSTKDIENESDIIEEIGRVIGYDNIDLISPSVQVAPVKLTPAQQLHRKIKDFLVFHGKSFEVMTYPLVGPKLLEKTSWNFGEELKLLNAISSEFDRMRTSLIPCLLDAVATNQKNSNQFRIFELGRSYFADEKSFSKEHSQLGVAFYNKDNKFNFLELTNTIERLLSSLNISYDLLKHNPKFKNNTLSRDWVGVHPFENLDIRIMGKIDGVITSIHPLVLRKLKIKGNVAIAIIDLSAFEERSIKDKIKYTPLPKFPGASFDCTVVIPKKDQVGKVLESLKKLKTKEITSVKIVDIFSLDDESNTVTLRANFLNPDKTLSSEVIRAAEEKIVDTLKTAGFPLKS